MYLTLIHLVSAIAMLGIIWVIQILHYPSFEYITLDRFKSFHKLHTRRISSIVIPLMIVELISAVVLNLLNPSIAQKMNLILIVAIWIVTFFVSVPLHQRLSIQKEFRTIEKLIKTNWIRTILWTVKLVLPIHLLLMEAK